MAVINQQTEVGGAQPFRWCLFQPGELRLKGFQASLATGRTLIVARVIFLFGFALVVRVIRFILSRETHCKGRRQRENKCQSPSPKAYSACYIYILCISLCAHYLCTILWLSQSSFFAFFSSFFSSSLDSAASLASFLSLQHCLSLELQNSYMANSQGAVKYRIHK